MAHVENPPGRAFFWLLLLATGLLYAGTFATPWIYDDLDGIRQNPALRAGASLAQVLNDSPPDSTPSGRPLVALSLASNHALGGFSPAGYRLFNLATHLASALLLTALVRRLLETRPGFDPARAGDAARWAALLFAAHPLATTVVTYTVQRAEGLMALFYLATLAAAARGLSGGGSRRWRTVSVLACALGMFAKETMVTAPLAVLLLHRGFFAASWREVARRWRWHLALASTWALLAACMLAWPRRQSVGFGLEGMDAAGYLKLQTLAWWHYLSLPVAPWRLALDHWPRTPATGTALAAGVGFAVLYAGTLVAAWRRSPALGAALALPGLVLLPTSTVIPIVTSPVADHRMYLPGAFALALVVAAARANSRRWTTVALLAAICALGTVTVVRNRVFRSERAVWEDAVAKDPGNPRALNNLGLALANAGLPAEGETRIGEALRLRGTYADAWYNLGTLQGRDGRLASAEESLRRALALRPGHAATHCNLALVLFQRGRRADAIALYEEAIRLRPDYPAACFNLAVICLEAGDPARALALAQACLRGDPGYPRARELTADLARLTQPKAGAR